MRRTVPRIGKFDPMRFLLALLFSIVAARGGDPSAGPGPQLGLQSWTCRRMTFEEVASFACAHHVTYIEFIAQHLDPLAPRAETLRKKALLERHGLVAYAIGVAPTSLDQEANRRLFDFARLMGIKLIIVEPKSAAEWDQLEALVKEFDIRIAVHNHGPGTRYADPADVKRALAGRDPRIGVCLDAGWITTTGFDAAKVFRDYDGRVFDLHFKDKKRDVTHGAPVWKDTLPGEGDVNFKGLMNEVRQSGWTGVIAIESDGEEYAADPGPLVDRAASLFREEMSATNRPGVRKVSP